MQQQQHQLMAQIQLTQQALMLGGNQNANENKPDSNQLLLKESLVKKERQRERHASETTLASSEGSLKENRSENIVKHPINGDPKSPLAPPVTSGLTSSLSPGSIPSNSSGNQIIINLYINSTFCGMKAGEFHIVADEIQ